MEKESRDKSSPSRDFNSPGKSSKLEEELELEKLEPSFLKKMLPTNSQKAHSADPSPDNKEDKI